MKIKYRLKRNKNKKTTANMSGAMKEIVSTFCRYLILLTKIHSTSSLPKQQKHKRKKNCNTQINTPKKEHNKEMKRNEDVERNKNNMKTVNTAMWW